MIELDLLPDDLKLEKKKKAQTSIKIPKIPVVPVAIAGVSIFILAHLGVSIFVASQKSRLIRLSGELEKISQQEQEALSLKKELDELNNRYSIIDSLTVGSLLWSKKLYDLSGAMTDGVWLSSLSLKSESQDDMAAAPQPGMGAPMPGAQAIGRQTLVLKGTAVSSTSGEETAIVGRFIKSLKRHRGFFKDFEDIKLSSIERKKVGESEVMDFTIVCYFKAGRSYFEKLEKQFI